MIDEGPGSLSGGQGNPMMSGGPGMTSRQQQDEPNQRTQYSMPGILHFLQTEWARFEMERSQWEVERAELQVEYPVDLNAIIDFSCEQPVWLLPHDVNINKSLTEMGR